MSEIKQVGGLGTPPELTPSEIQALYNILRSEGSYNEAINRYTRAMELRPNDQECLVNRSRCYMMLGNTSQSLMDVSIVLKDNPKNIKAIYQKAEVLYARGDFEDALVLFYRGMKERPEITGFRVGVHKSEVSIQNAIALLDPRELRQMIKTEAAKEVVDERNLIEELYEDKVFMTNLLNDESLCRSCHGSIGDLVVEGLAFIQTRVEFWRQRNPTAAASAVIDSIMAGNKKNF